MCIENKGLHYNDIYLMPSYFDGTSRSSISTQSKLGKFTFDLPVIPANMKCVIDINCAEKMTESWVAPYIMHRFGDTFKFVQDANKQGLNFISISVGVKENDSDLLNSPNRETIINKYGVPSSTYKINNLLYLHYKKNKIVIALIENQVTEIIYYN